MRLVATAAALAAAAALTAAPAYAQELADPANDDGGAVCGGRLADVLARILGHRMSELLGRQVIVESTTGAGGMTGSIRVARAAPDGYQFVIGSQGTHAQNQALYKNPPYHSVADFAPVALVVLTPLVLVVRKDLPANDFKEFAHYLKENLDTMQFGSAGAGSGTHLGCVLLNAALGASVTPVPYRGAAPAMQDLQAGRIDYLCDVISTALPQIEAKTVKGMAVLNHDRAPVLPDLPTAQEQGLTNFEAPGWFALFLPKGTPGAIVRRLNEALSDTLDTPAVRERLEALAMGIRPPEHRSPEFLTGFVASEIQKWTAPIKAVGITLD